MVGDECGVVKSDNFVFFGVFVCYFWLNMLMIKFEFILKMYLSSGV